MLRALSLQRYLPQRFRNYLIEPQTHDHSPLTFLRGCRNQLGNGDDKRHELSLEFHCHIQRNGSYTDDYQFQPTDYRVERIGSRHRWKLLGCGNKSGPRRRCVELPQFHCSDFHTKPISGARLVDLGTVTLEEQTVHIRASLDMTLANFNWAAVDNSLDPTSLVILAILFDKQTSFNGNSVTFTGVNAAGSSYANFNKSFVIHSVLSGTLTITISTPAVGSSVSGQITLTLDDGTKLQSSIIGTIVSYS